MNHRTRNNPYDASLVGGGSSLLQGAALLLLGMLLGHILTIVMQSGDCEPKQGHFRQAPQPQEPNKKLEIPTAMQNDRKKTSSQFNNLKDLPLVPTSHEQILKQEVIKPFSVHPYLSGVSVGLLQPHQTIHRHSHKSMSEFFLVLSGRGYAKLHGSEALIPVQEGSFLFVGPNYNHSFIGPEAAARLPEYAKIQGSNADPNSGEQQPLKLLYFGMTDD